MGWAKNHRHVLMSRISCHTGTYESSVSRIRTLDSPWLGDPKAPATGTLSPAHSNAASISAAAVAAAAGPSRYGSAMPSSPMAGPDAPAVRRGGRRRRRLHAAFRASRAPSPVPSPGTSRASPFTRVGATRAAWPSSHVRRTRAGHSSNTHARCTDSNARIRPPTGPSSR
jgi:hypothetical protein